jgi:peptide/nickel transport system substrate-binding protein
MHGTPKHPAGFAHFPYVNPAAPKGGRISLGALGTSTA